MYGPGDPLRDPPIEEGDLTFAGIRNLRYMTVTARRRWFMPGVAELNVGFGLMLGGSYEDVRFWQQSGLPPERFVYETPTGAFSLELLVGHKLSRHFGVKWGLTQDFNFETANTQLVGLGVIGF